MPSQKRSVRLQIVLDQIAREEEQERLKLGEIRTQVQGSEARIEQLVDYQRQYQEDLRASQSSVRSISQIQTYHAFISRLGTAIEQQQSQTLILKQKQKVQTQKWQAVYQKMKNMEDFIQRCRDEEAIEADKKEQRQLDDEVNRRAFKGPLG